MPQFDIVVERSGREYELTIDAPDQKAAEAAAIEHISGAQYMTDDERQAKIADLESQQAQIEQEGTPQTLIGKSVSALVGAIPFVKQTTANRAGAGVEQVGAQTGLQTAGGLGQLALETGESASDAVGAVAGLVGADTVAKGAESVSGFLRRRQDELDQATYGMSIQSMESLMGRKLADDEKESIRQSTFRGMDYAEMAGELTAGGAVAGLKVFQGARTLKAALGLGATEGFLTTYLLADSEGETMEGRAMDRVTQASVGAVFGGLANGAIVGVPAGIKNMYGRYIRSEIERAGGMQQYLKDVEDTGVYLTLGQWTGNPSILLAEQNAIGAAGQSFLARQKLEIINNIAEAHGVRLPAISELGGGISEQLGRYADEVGRAINREKGRVNVAYRARLKAAEDVYAGPVFKPEGMDETLFRIADEANRSYGTKGLTPGFEKLIWEMAESIEKGASARQINDWSTALNNFKKADGSGVLKKPEGITQEAYEQLKKNGMAYVSAVEQTLNGAIRRGTPVSQEAALAMDRIKHARSIYHQRKTALGDSERELITTLGLHGGNALDVINNLKRQDVKQLEKAVGWLKETDGGIMAMGQLKEATVHAAAAEAASGVIMGTGARAGQFSLADFVRAYGRNTDAAVASKFMTETERAYGQRAVEVIRRILNSASVEPGVIKTHNPINISNIAINAASRDPGFIARLLGATIESGKGADWLFHSKEGIQTLLDLENVVVGGKSGPEALRAANIAAITLMDMLEGVALEPGE